ncbi:hypothetical protein [Aurantimonas coralicida]|uniref:hypothetical protein n=1 Tax=Aurantimonas coralicida TaxID=182270 RepID=UPI001E4A01DB|nr:hypothetical protein [Aurantimonas coralicida]MCD1642911.1 hypothetical protein [Aurantimonas coralicida]
MLREVVAIAPVESGASARLVQFVYCETVTSPLGNPPSMFGIYVALLNVKWIVCNPEDLTILSTLAGANKQPQNIECPPYYRTTLNDARTSWGRNRHNHAAKLSGIVQ